MFFIEYTKQVDWAYINQKEHEKLKIKIVKILYKDKVIHIN